MCYLWQVQKIWKTQNTNTCQKKHQFFLLFEVSVKMKKKKMFKEEESIEILKILRLIKNIKLL